MLYLTVHYATLGYPIDAKGFLNSIVADPTDFRRGVSTGEGNDGDVISCSLDASGSEFVK